MTDEDQCGGPPFCGAAFLTLCDRALLRLPMASTESPSEPDPTIRVGVLVRREMLHVADTMNPDRQEWEYDADTLGAFTRHLEAIGAAAVRVGTSRSPGHALRLLRHILEVPVAITVLEGVIERAHISEPADLLGTDRFGDPARPAAGEAAGQDATSPTAPEADRRSELRAISRRIDQLRSIREDEEDRISGIEATEIADSIREHVSWLTDRERDLEGRLLDRMRARPWWYTASPEEEPP